MLAGAAVLLAAGAPAMAVSTQFFKHVAKADFETGKLENVVATNFGELRLVRALEDVIKDDATIGSIECLLEAADGTIYVGTSAHGKLISIKGKDVATVLDLGDEVSVLSMKQLANGDILIGTGGEEGKLWKLPAGSKDPEEVVAPEDVQYIWSIHDAGNGKVYLATGPNGQLMEVDLAAKTSKEVLKTKENNILHLVGNATTLYFGTDPNGLVYKFDIATAKTFVVYDAPETEIGALVLDPAGNLYVGTSQAVEVAEEEETASEEAASAGRPIGAVAQGAMPHTPAPAPKPHDNGATALLDGGPTTEPAEPKADAMPDGADKPEEGKEEKEEEDADEHSSAGPVAVGVTGSSESAEGNAVYRVAPDGFVAEVFRGNVMVMDLAMQDGKLLIAAGGRGELLQYDPASEETIVVAKPKRKFLTTLLPTKDGRLVIGSAGSAAVSVLSAGVASEGSITSKVLDAGQIARFGNLHINGSLPANTKLTVSTRSGNLEDPTAAGWSDWSAAAPVERFVPVSSPSARFIQYKLSFTSDGKTSPVVDDLSLAYQLANLPPRIESITVGTEEGKRKIEWVAKDPNEDALKYAVYMRPSVDSPWIQLAKDLTEATYEWDAKQVSDGRYDIRVEASDLAANAPGEGKVSSRIADPHIVDNTPPSIGDIEIKKEAGKATVNFRAVDKLGIIASMEFSIDGLENWQKILPSSILSDSPDESYSIALDLAQTARVVSLRAKDDSGNVAYQTVIVRP
jgi:hypothetical protein